MEFLRELEELQEIRIPRYVVRDRSNPLENYNNVQFFEKFRLTKVCVRYIFGRVQESLQVHSNRRIPVPPMLQFLGTLRIYVTGSFQSVVGELLSVSQPTMSRMIRRVSSAIATHHEEFIRFPAGKAVLLNQRQFYEIGGFLGVIGTIDCTHFEIDSPGGPTAELYRNRKGYFSINVQAVCNSNLKLVNIIVRWSGSVHDSRIFNNSRLCAHFENGDIQGTLLGDFGYAFRPYLMTPILNPQTAAETRYNYAHCRTRNTVERLFGIWKRRFPCLSTGLRVKKETVLIIIVSEAVLHNRARTYNADETNLDNRRNDDSDDEDDDENDDVIRGHRPVNRLGVAVRNTIIQQHFAILTLIYALLYNYVIIFR